MKTIFVSISAYNEIDLLDTINSCFDNAKHPNRVYIGIWNHTNNIVSEKFNNENIKTVYAEYGTMLGVGISRMNAISLYDNEDYFFQIDGHMMFDKNWDEKIINGFENIKLKYEKPIISTYTPWWSRNEDGTINYYTPENNAQCSPMEYDQQILNEFFPKQKTYGVDWNNADYYEHYGISAHFIFTEGSFVYDIAPDPFLMFSGEEPTTAVRAWTRGYRMFVIKPAIAWHKNKFHGFNHQFDRLKYHGDMRLHSHYLRKNKISLLRTKDILTGKLLGYWGANSLELLKEYEFYARIDFNEFYKRVGEF
jgi:hypothetical protein